MSEEQKQKISKSRKKYLEEHPDQVPYLLNHSSEISAPEQYFITLFENENIPQHFIIDKFNEYLTKIKKELAKGRTHRVGGKIPKEWLWYRGF